VNGLLERAHPTPTHRARRLIGQMAGVAVGLAALFGALQLTRGPEFVSHVDIVNRTEFQLNAQVTDAHRDGWLGLRVVQPESTTIVRDVIDQGDAWIFQFSRAGTTAGELRVTRDQLENDDWQIVVPKSFEKPLRNDGQRCDLC
jgi:hypothetical protein